MTMALFRCSLVIGLVATSLGSLAAQINSRVSVGSGGTQSPFGGGDGVASSDGRYIAFETLSALDVNDNNGKRDIYVYDRRLNTTKRVSVKSDGSEVLADSRYPSISGDGKVIAFVSDGEFQTGVTGQHVWAHVRDFDLPTDPALGGGSTKLISRSPGGVPGNDDSDDPVVSDDGEWVIFFSFATNLVPTDTNGSYGDAFVRKVSTSKMAVVTVDSSGQQHSGGDPIGPGGLDISADGRFVVFDSDASNLLPPGQDTNAMLDVFVHDRDFDGDGVYDQITAPGGGAGIATVRVSVGNSIPFLPPLQGNMPSVNGQISSDGRFVTFESEVGGSWQIGNANFNVDLWVHDRDPNGDGFDNGDYETRIITAITESGDSYLGAISGDGSKVCFGSPMNSPPPGSGLTVGSGTFLVDLGVAPPAYSRETVTASGQPTDGGPTDITKDGRFSVFGSDDPQIVTGDTNQALDVFVRGPEFTLGTRATEVHLGDYTQFDVWKGPPGNIVWLQSALVGGSFVFTPFNGVFDANGGWTLGGTFNAPGQVNQTIRFRCAAISASGATKFTNEVAITFLP